MTNVEEELKGLENLWMAGMISEQEYQFRRGRVLGIPSKIWGLDEHTFLMLMHLSQLTGFVLPLVMWLTNKENPLINRHGENIANFMISMYIFAMIALFMCLFLIGYLVLPVLAVLQLVYIIRIAMDADKCIYTEYPFCFKIFPAR